MTPSNWLLAYVKSKEKFRPTAYKPTKKDVFTIAWGHTKDVQAGDTCTTAQGITWLQEDMATAVTAVNKVAVPLSQNQFDALVSLVFNIGAGAFEESTLLRYLNDSKFTAAADEFLRWDHQDGYELDGLHIRRTEERAIFLWVAPEPFPIQLSALA